MPRILTNDELSILHTLKRRGKAPQTIGDGDLRVDIQQNDNYTVAILFDGHTNGVLSTGVAKFNPNDRKTKISKRGKKYTVSAMNEQVGASIAITRAMSTLREVAPSRSIGLIRHAFATAEQASATLQ